MLLLREMLHVRQVKNISSKIQEDSRRKMVIQRIAESLQNSLSRKSLVSFCISPLRIPHPRFADSCTLRESPYAKHLRRMRRIQPYVTECERNHCRRILGKAVVIQCTRQEREREIHTCRDPGPDRPDLLSHRCVFSNQWPRNQSTE